MAGDADLLFKIKADAGQARDELGRFKKKVDDDLGGVKAVGKSVEDAYLKVGQSFGFSGQQLGQFKAMASAAAPILGALTVAGGAIASAYIGAGTALFNMAKTASDAGSKIHDLSEQTGLSAEALSSLDFAAGQSGSSIEALSSEISKFTKLIGEANNGSDQAKIKLQSLGLDTQKPITDLNAALSTAFRTIYNARPGIEQGTLAMTAFGKSGANAIPVINSFNGNLEQLMATAKRLGVQLSRENVDAADEFGDALNLLEVQSKSTFNKMALEYAPAVTQAMKEVSKILVENKDLIIETGRGLGLHFEILTRQLNGTRAAWEGFKTSLTTGNLPLSLALALAGRGGGAPSPSTSPVPAVTDEAGQTTRVIDYGNAVQVTPQGDRIRTPEQMAAERKKAQQELERANELVRGALSTAADVAFQRAIAQANALLERTNDYVSYIAKAKVAEAERWEARERQFAAERSDIARGDDAEGVKAARLKANLAQEEMSRAEYNLRVEELNRELGDKALASLQETHRRKRELEEAESDWYIDHQRKLAERGAITFEEAQERVEKEMRSRFKDRTAELQEEKAAAVNNADAYDQITHALEMLRDEYRRFNRDADQNIFDARGQDATAYLDKLREILHTLDDIQNKPVEVPGVGGSGVGGRFGGVTPGSEQAPPVPFGTDVFENWGRVVSDVFGSVGNVAQTVGGIINNVFGQMADGVGNAVKSFVLFGSAGGSIRKFAAEMIASVAQMAAIQAIYQLAQGLAWLALSIFFPNPQYVAAAHTAFLSAAVFGGIAGVAAVAGRAVAGNSFASGGGGGAVAGEAYGGASGSNEHEDYRTKYLREQAEKDKNSRREDRRGDGVPIVVQLIADGRELARTTLNAIRDGGDVRDGFKSSFGIA